MVSFTLSFNPQTHEGCATWKMKTTPRLTVSIHTPTKGVTWWQLVNDAPVGVSIHTPTKGVTGRRSRPGGGGGRFNPHTHEGCDYAWFIWEKGYKGFNPHTHEGCDSSTTTFQARDTSFNPHTHEGCDSVVPPCVAMLNVSIHTPTKGVTGIRLSHILLPVCFNPHTHEGCDCIFSK